MRLRYACPEVMFDLLKASESVCTKYMMEKVEILNCQQVPSIMFENISVLDPAFESMKESSQMAVRHELDAMKMTDAVCE